MNECSHYRQRRLYRLINHHPFTNAHRNQMECSHTRPVSFIHVGSSARWSRYYFSRALIKLSSIVRITKWSWSAARWSAVYLCPVGSIASVAVLLPPRICINVVIPALSSFMICLEMQCSFGVFFQFGTCAIKHGFYIWLRDRKVREESKKVIRDRTISFLKIEKSECLNIVWFRVCSGVRYLWVKKYFKNYFWVQKVFFKNYFWGKKCLGVESMK